MKFRFYIPSHVFDPRDPKKPDITFNSLEELLSIKELVDLANDKGDDFYRYSKGKQPQDYKGQWPYILMAEYDNGKDWWVVGFLSDDIDLPIWEPIE